MKINCAMIYLYKAVFSESLNISFKCLQFKHSRNHRAKICYHRFLREIESKLIDLGEGGFEYLPFSTQAALPWGCQSQVSPGAPPALQPKQQAGLSHCPPPSRPCWHSPATNWVFPCLLQGETPAASARRRKEALQAQPVTTLQVLRFKRQSEEACSPSPSTLQVV